MKLVESKCEHKLCLDGWVKCSKIVDQTRWKGHNDLQFLPTLFETASKKKKKVNKNKKQVPLWDCLSQNVILSSVYMDE